MTDERSAYSEQRKCGSLLVWSILVLLLKHVFQTLDIPAINGLLQSPQLMFVLFSVVVNSAWMTFKHVSMVVFHDGNEIVGPSFPVCDDCVFGLRILGASLLDDPFDRRKEMFVFILRMTILHHVPEPEHVARETLLLFSIYLNEGWQWGVNLRELRSGPFHVSSKDRDGFGLEGKVDGGESGREEEGGSHFCLLFV